MAIPFDRVEIDDMQAWEYLSFDLSNPKKVI